MPTLQEDWDTAVDALVTLAVRIEGATGIERTDYEERQVAGSEIRRESIATRHCVTVTVPLPVTAKVPAV